MQYDGLAIKRQMKMHAENAKVNLLAGFYTLLHLHEISISTFCLSFL